MVIDLLFIFTYSFLICGTTIGLSKSLNFGLDLPSNSPQKFHNQAVPRLGGFAIFGSLIIYAYLHLNGGSLFYLLMATIPAFFGGVGEDLSGKFNPLSRLILTFLSAGIAWYWLDFQLLRVGVYFFDDLLENWWWLSLLFTMFAVGGVAHSVNIIDGYNGLMGGVGLLAGICFIVIASLVGDMLVVHLVAMLSVATLGFFLWNFYFGKIFMGDGGAYVIGFLLAETAVILVGKHPEISPWSCFLIMAYPIVETLFSMYRKKILRNISIGQPDGLHFHMLVYKRIAMHHAREKNKNKQWAHTITSLILYIFALTPMIFVPFVFKSSFWSLIILCLFVSLYVWLYFKLLPTKNKKTFAKKQGII